MEFFCKDVKSTSGRESRTSLLVQSQKAMLTTVTELQACWGSLRSPVRQIGNYQEWYKGTSKHGKICMKLRQEVRPVYSGFFPIWSWNPPWMDTEENFWAIYCTAWLPTWWQMTFLRPVNATALLKKRSPWNIVFSSSNFFFFFFF